MAEVYFDTMKNGIPLTRPGEVRWRLIGTIRDCCCAATSWTTPAPSTTGCGASHRCGGSRGSTFLVSDPSLVREAVRRTDDFSSNLVSVLHDDGAGCPVAYAMAPFGDPIHVLATADPPLHARHRRLLQSHLSPATVSALEPAVIRIVDDHLDRLLDSSPVDFVAVFGDPVPRGPSVK